MKSKKIALVALSLVNLLAYSQENIIELPLTGQNGHGPFSLWYVATMSPISENNGAWQKISKFPEGLTDIKYGYIETNDLQDTINPSTTSVKNKIAFAYGKDSEGNIKVAVDTNNNNDLSDDNIFTPIDYSVNHPSEVEKLTNYAVNVSFETFVHNKIVTVTVPLFVYYNSRNDNLFYHFWQHSTTQLKGQHIAVSSGRFTNFTYKYLELTLLPNDLNAIKIVEEKDIYKKNEYIEIEDEIYKILGVNTNRNTLVLEKNDLPKTQLFSNQIGYKSHLFQGEDIASGTKISLENYKGKYVLLDFWGEWCKPCIEELPNLKELYSKTDRTKFEMIGIAAYSTYEGIKKLIDQHGIAWPQISSDAIVATYGINVFPTTILLDIDGVVIAKNLGGNRLEEKILNLIKE